MTLQAISPDSLVRDLGDVWVSTVLVTSDTSGLPVTGTLTATATDPSSNDTSVTATALTRGVYQLAVDLTAAGRWLLRVVEPDHGAAVFAVDVLAAVEARPTLAQVLDYLGETSETDAAVAAALAAETAAQASACRIPATYPPDLAEALKRRVARNLAAKAVPVATFTSFEGGGTSTRVPMIDPEVARLERPWRRIATRIG
jgi:hypothetical protein